MGTCCLTQENPKLVLSDNLQGWFGECGGRKVVSLILLVMPIALLYPTVHTVHGSHGSKRPEDLRACRNRTHMYSLLADAATTVGSYGIT